MTPLPPNPTPTEVHIRLLTLMGWTEQQLETWIPAAPLDDNLLRKARERLLTTGELQYGYIMNLHKLLKQETIWAMSLNEVFTLISAPILTHAIAICRAVESLPSK